MLSTGGWALLLGWLISVGPEPVCAPNQDVVLDADAGSTPMMTHARPWVETKDDITLWRPSEVHDGQLLVIELQTTVSCPSPSVAWELSLFNTYPLLNGHLQALLPVPLGAKAGEQKLGILCEDSETNFYIPITSGMFVESRLRVDNKFTSPPPARVVQEAASITAALSKSAATRLWTQLFVKPGTGEITSPFGVKRTYNGQLKNRHFGLDLEGRVGDPQWASNDGIVTLAAKDFFYVGNAVFIDHGDNLFSMYFHMTQLMVKTGDRVIRGQQLGTVGGTGRVTGPHIHFAVKLAGIYINPLDVLAFRPAFAPGASPTSH